MKIAINGKSYELGKEIGSGGFGRVFECDQGSNAYAVKLIPKADGASRDLLFVDLDKFENVIPILDTGETPDHWVIVMPRADHSLRAHLLDVGSSPDLALDVLADINKTLLSLEADVVHRDIKPENILFYEGAWRLSDFGISRYAEATTASDTQKYAISAPYAAPERWRSERANSRTDIYSLGVVAYEVSTAARPFPGPSTEDYRHQHLEDRPDRPNLESNVLSDLIEEMLYKSAEARPAPAAVKKRLSTIQDPPAVRIASLESANTAEVERQGQIETERQSAAEEQDRRARLRDDATEALTRISGSLKDAVSSSAPSAEFARNSSTSSWFVRLNRATLEMPYMSGITYLSWGEWQDPPVFDVIATAEIILKNSEQDRARRQGRSHALWFCDALEEGNYQWYETAFMGSPFIPRSNEIEPFSLEPGEDAAKALWAGVAEVQVAWPFTLLDSEGTQQFVERWGNWFGEASQHGYQPPSRLPEMTISSDWRRK